ncbi:unnamed protein product [Timema podura]|uniref:Ubiquitin-like domain-containing protein n=1 Tax=Timema podura TaxID=61482 RepID=A0ABN7NQL8_TIMPD|nr:unnamed protein product [Timema podura]
MVNTKWGKERKTDVRLTKEADQGDCSSTPEPHDSSDQHLCKQESSSRQPCEIEASDEHLCEKDSSDSQNHAGVLPPPKQYVDFKVIYNKTKYDINFAVDDTVVQLKQYLQDVIGVPQAMQKVMIKGLAKDERTLRDLGVVKGAKVMVVGSKLDDVLAVSTPSKQVTGSCEGR